MEKKIRINNIVKRNFTELSQEEKDKWCSYCGCEGGCNLCDCMKLNNIN